MCRGLIKSGHSVIVVMTKGSLQFIKPETFYYLGAQDVFKDSDDFISPNHKPSSSLSTPVLHINLVRWATRVIIAPCSANTLAKLAHGMCDDLLSSLYLAKGDLPVIFFLAMNTKMYLSKKTQNNLKLVSEDSSVYIFPPTSGELICGDKGEGKFADIQTIIDVTPLISFQLNSKRKKLKNVLISAGATKAPLDPIRYLTNPASGKTGLELAKYYLSQNYQVTVVCGEDSSSHFQTLTSLENFKLLKVITVGEMKKEILKFFPKCDIYISAAAICDFEFTYEAKKIKKSSLKSGNLPYKLAPDILASVVKIKKSHQKVVGFAAETELTKINLLEKWNRKPVDLLVGNIVNGGLEKKSPKLGFQQEEGLYYFVKNGLVGSSQRLFKKDLPHVIDRILNPSKKTESH